MTTLTPERAAEITAEPGPTALWSSLAGFALPHRQHLVAAGRRLAAAGEPIASIYVPLGALLLVARQTPLDPVPLTVGLIGGEAFAGGAALLDIDTWSHDTIVLAGGGVAVVAIDDLRAATARHPALHARLLRVLHNQMMQLAQSVVANLGHSLERRLARWLTMLHDRVAGEAIAVTHDQLAQLLNVRRASITDALHILEGEHLVRAGRGRVVVRDRAALQARAGQSYGLSEDDYRRHLGPFGKGLMPEQP